MVICLKKKYFINDIKQKEISAFYSNGTIIYKGNYKNNTPTGNWFYYYKSGKLEKKKNYNNFKYGTNLW